MTMDARRYSAAAERNRGPILAELQRLLPAAARVLEVASGSGQHAAHAGAAMPGWRWQPSEADALASASIDAWCHGLANVAPAITLDVLAPAWPQVPVRLDAVFCANLLHIAPWPVCAALMQGAARHLAPGGLLLLYGPFVADGEAVAAGNRAFDAELRSRQPQWGLRLLSAVLAEAATAGLRLQERVAMPANNLLLVLGLEP